MSTQSGVGADSGPELGSIPTEADQSIVHLIDLGLWFQTNVSEGATTSEEARIV